MEHQARDVDGFLTPRQVASYKNQKMHIDTLERKKGEIEYFRACDDHHLGSVKYTSGLSRAIPSTVDNNGRLATIDWALLGVGKHRHGINEASNGVEIMFFIFCKLKRLMLCQILTYGEPVNMQVMILSTEFWVLGHSIAL